MTRSMTYCFKQIFNSFPAYIQPSNYCWRSKVHPSLPPILPPPTPVPSCTWYHYHSPQAPTPPSLPVTLPPTPAALSPLPLVPDTSHLFCSPLHPLLCLALPHPLITRHFSALSLCISVPSFSQFCSSTYHCPCGSLWTPPSPSLSTFWHSMCRWWTSFCVPSAPFPPLPLPSSRPTYSTGAHHTCRRAHTRPRAVNTVLGPFVLYCSSTAGGVSVGWERSSPSASDLGEECRRTKST